MQPIFADPRYRQMAESLRSADDLNATLSATLSDSQALEIPVLNVLVPYLAPGQSATTFQSGKNGTVTYELIPEGDRTRLVLTHSGITSGTGAQDFGSGWNSHLTVLQEKLAGRGVKNFWALHAQSKEAVRQALV